MSGDFYKKVAANDMESANPASKHQTATQPRRLRFGKEEQGSGRMTSFLPQAEKDVGAKRTLLRRGMSGDTELFENPSNIKDLWASEQKTILYTPLF